MKTTKSQLPTPNILRMIFVILVIFVLAGTVQARPDKVEGVYISIWTMGVPQKFKHIVDRSVENGLNSIVCDFEGSSRLYKSNLDYAKAKGLYCIARIVVFQDGVGATIQTFQDPINWNKKIAWAKEAESIGFAEVQYDYIRFADTAAGSAEKKKEIIEQFLKEAKASVSVPVGIDVFGSVAYQPRQSIGQDLARLANIIDVVSPLLYPSHFDLDKKRMSQPYETMLEGCLMAKKQLTGRPVRLIPFIQGFPLRLSYSGMNLKDYIIAQLKAVKAAGTDGYYIWHAGNDYTRTWEALKELNGIKS